MDFFETGNILTDPEWIVKEFFNACYSQDALLRALTLIVNKTSYSINQEYCFFPDYSDPNPVYHFDGVEFGVMHDKIILTTGRLYFYLLQACDIYRTAHPEHEQEIRNLIKEIHKQKGKGSAGNGHSF